LQRAFGEASKLSTQEQDTLATIVLEEIEDDARWEASFARSQKQLSRLADKVRQDIRDNKVSAAGIDEL
jgi:hypothetical protein